MKQYRCHRIVGDKYAGEWVTEAFRKAGAHYIQSDRDRSAVYMDTLPIFTSGRARILDNPKLISQFASLERRTFSTGRERIDPGPGYDDLANSVAIALSLLAMTSMVRITDAHIAAIKPSAHGLRSRFSSRPRPFVGSVSDFMN